MRGNAGVSVAVAVTVHGGFFEACLGVAACHRFLQVAQAGCFGLGQIVQLKGPAQPLVGGIVLALAQQLHGSLAAQFHQGARHLLLNLRLRWKFFPFVQG